VSSRPAELADHLPLAQDLELALADEVAARMLGRPAAKGAIRMKVEEAPQVSVHR